MCSIYPTRNACVASQSIRRTAVCYRLVAMTHQPRAFAWRHDLQLLKSRPRPFQPKKQTHNQAADLRKRPVIARNTDIIITTISTRMRKGISPRESRTGTPRYRHDIPECLDTSSNFYNPATPANERYEKYLQEMNRRTHEDNRVRSLLSPQWAHPPSVEVKGKTQSSHTVLPKIELSASNSTDVVRSSL